MTTVNDSDVISSSDSATVIVQTPQPSVPSPKYSLSIPGTIPGRFNILKSSKPFSFLKPFATQIPGSPMYGPFNGLTQATQAANVVSNVGWEVSVTDGTTLTLMALVPRFYNLSFSKEFAGEGSGQIVIDRSDPVFSMMTMAQGAGTDLIDKENVFTIYYEGLPVFDFYAETVDESQVDASTEQQPVTISGPGTARSLQWAKVFSPGFPNVVYKITSLADTFSSPKVNTTLWNLTAPTNIQQGTIYIDTQHSAAAITGRPYPTYPAPALSAGPFDMTNCGVSVQVSPIGQANPPTNQITNGTMALGTQGWNSASSAIQNSGASLSPFTGDSQDGSGQSLQVFCPVQTQTKMGAEQQVSGLPANTYFQVSGWVKKIQGFNPVLQVRDLTNNTTFPSVTAVAVVGQWIQVSCSFSTGPTANASVLVSFNSGPTSGQPSKFLLQNVYMYSGVPQTYTTMTIAPTSQPAKNYAQIQLNWWNTFNATIVNNGVVQNIVLKSAYDPVEDAYWRIREFNKTVFFETSPDGVNWVTLGSGTYLWNPSSVSVSFSAAYDSHITAAVVNTLLPALFSNINNGLNPGLINAYSSVPNMAIFLDLLNQAQRRGCIPFVLPQFTVTTDSAGIPWTDTASLTVDNGGDLETQLQASIAAVPGDWVMQPGFQLFAGNPGSLGEDQSSTVIFHQSGQMMTSERLRVRDQIANYIVCSDGTGNLVLAEDLLSGEEWGHREGYVESASPTTTQTLQNMANAALREYKDEQTSRTIDVPPNLPARRVFIDYDVGDWIGVQDTNLYDIETLRVMTISATVDQSENVTVELTLDSRIMLLSELMNNLLQKIGASAAAQVLPAPGAAARKVTVSQTSASSSSYTQIVGDGSTTVFPIVHALGTKSCHVSIWGTASPFSLLAPSAYSVTADSPQQVTVTFTSAPTAGQYRIVVSL